MLEIKFKNTPKPAVVDILHQTGFKQKSPVHFTKRSYSKNDALIAELVVDYVNSGYQYLNGVPFATDSEMPDEEITLDGTVNAYEYVTNIMIEQLQGNSIPPWQKNWGSNPVLPAMSWPSKKQYSGINRIMLNFVYNDKETKNPYFLTFKKVKKANGKVKEGSKAAPVVFFVMKYKDKNTNKYITEEEYEERKKDKEDRKNLLLIPVISRWSVYNGSQIEGIDFKIPEVPKLNQGERIAEAENIVKSYSDKPKLGEKGDPAYYPGADKVTMPDITEFASEEEYYGTLFHELIHSTKIATRLDRDKGYKGKNKDAVYAFEELVAEMGANFLCYHAQIAFTNQEKDEKTGQIKNSAAYLKYWKDELVKHMKDDPTLLYKAASAAEKAADYILRDWKPLPKGKGGKDDEDAKAKELALASAAAKAFKLKLKLKKKSKEQQAKKEEDPAKKKVETKAKSTRTGVQDVPLDNIKTNKNLFQNRDEDYSSESVNRIKEAVANGDFNWAVFDPILLWNDPKGQLYVLSGHSRFHAFKELSKAGAKAQGKGFDAIPAKVIEVSQAEAQKIARESNNLSTRETDTERAKYYRNLRSDGKTKTELMDLAKKNEGRNANKIINLSYLAANGKAMSSLKSLENSGGSSSQNSIAVIADWVGEIRKRYPDLRTTHENEITTWLMQKGYGNKAGQFSAKTKFIERMHVLIQHNTEFGKFQADKPLNINRVLDKNSGEQEFDIQIAELKEAEKKAKRTFDKKVVEYYDAVKEGLITQAKADDLIKKYQLEWAATKAKLNKFGMQKNRYVKDGKAQAQLFGLSVSDEKGILNAVRNAFAKINSKAKANLYNLKKRGKRVISSANTQDPKPVAIVDNVQKKVDNQVVTPSEEPTPKIGGVISTTQLSEMEFDSLPIRGKWYDLIQDLPKNASSMIWGKGKNGKTSFCLQFADYLSQYGRVLYNFADQGINATTKKLLSDMGVIGNPNIDLTQVRNIVELKKILDTGAYDFVFIDLVQDYENAKPKTFKDLKESYPNIGFHLVMESTKDGQFKGDNGWEHLPDELIDVVEYKAYSKGRLGNGQIVVWPEYWAKKEANAA